MITTEVTIKPAQKL